MFTNIPGFFPVMCSSTNITYLFGLFEWYEYILTFVHECHILVKIKIKPQKPHWKVLFDLHAGCNTPSVSPNMIERESFKLKPLLVFLFPAESNVQWQSPIFREQSFVPFLESPPMSWLTPYKVALFNVWPWDREAVVPACPPLYCHSSTSVRRLQLEMSQICSTCHIGSATVGNTSSKFCVKDVLFRCVSLGTRLCAIGDVLTHSCALERCSWCLLTFEAYHKDFSF